MVYRTLEYPVGSASEAVNLKFGFKSLRYLIVIKNVHDPVPPRPLLCQAPSVRFLTLVVFSDISDELISSLTWQSSRWTDIKFAIKPVDGP